MKVLICDDDQILGAVMSKILQAAGMDCVLIPEGTRMLDVIRLESPDIVLLDLMLPHKDGYAILSEIKADPAAARIPVMIVSAFESREYIEAAMAMGAADYLIKPFGAEDLRTRVAKAAEG